MKVLQQIIDMQAGGVGQEDLDMLQASFELAKRAQQIAQALKLLEQLAEPFRMPQPSMDKWIGQIDSRNKLAVQARELLQELNREAFTIRPTGPQKVLEALLHIRQFHPGVDRVVYDLDRRWDYQSQEAGRVLFMADHIDVGLLEDAADQVTQLPAVYFLVEEE